MQDALWPINMPIDDGGQRGYWSTSTLQYFERQPIFNSADGESYERISQYDHPYHLKEGRGSIRKHYVDLCERKFSKFFFTFLFFIINTLRKVIRGGLRFPLKLTCFERRRVLGYLFHTPQKLLQIAITYANSYKSLYQIYA